MAKYTSKYWTLARDGKKDPTGVVNSNESWVQIRRYLNKEQAILDAEKFAREMGQAIYLQEAVETFETEQPRVIRTRF